MWKMLVKYGNVLREMAPNLRFLSENKLLLHNHAKTLEYIHKRENRNNMKNKTLQCFMTYSIRFLALSPTAIMG